MKIEFIEDKHIYLCDGVIVPSVSQLIRFKYPGQYDGVPDAVLKKKADYGTKVHRMIESYVSGEITLEELKKRRVDPDIKIAVEQFQILLDKYLFNIRDMEQTVSWKGRYAGTYDIRTDDNIVIDLKTTSSLHEDWLQWQLSLYAMAAGADQRYGYVIWLPKGKMGQVKQIDLLPAEECVRLVDEYEKHTSGS